MKTTTRPIACLILFAAVALAAYGNGSAQENQFPPSGPLQWPTDVSNNSTLFLAVSSLRSEIQDAANASLCRKFMKDANILIPDPFMYGKDCPSSIKSMIDAGKGSPRWKQGARPLECGSSCMDAPLIVQTLNLGTPNVRYGTVAGNVDLEVDEPVGTRVLRFYLHVDVTCDIPAGTRAGMLNVTSVVEPPTVEGPGPLESILNGLAEVFTVHLADDITQGIEKALGSHANSTTSNKVTVGPCSSIGLSDNSFVWDVPRKTIGVIGSEIAKPSVSLHFDHITNMMPPNSPGTTVNPPPIPRLTLYVNGVPAHIPFPQNATSHDSKLCVTFPMDGADRLQLLLSDGAGGAIWSQFAPATNFGSGSHNLTTVRNVIVTDTNGKPKKGTSPGVELDYHIVFHSTPGSTGATTAQPTTGPGLVHGHTSTTSTLGTASDQSCINSTR